MAETNNGSPAIPVKKPIIKISSRGWPWQTVDGHWASNLDKTSGQKYGWNPFSVKGMGRFGGGWAFKFGITASSGLRDFVIDLGLGSIRVTFNKLKGRG